MNPTDAERQFSLFAHSLPDALLLATGDGEIRAANRAAGACLTLPAGSLTGKRLADMVSDSPERVQAFLTACARSREPLPGTLNVRRPDSGTFPCRVTGATIVPRSEDAPAIVQMRLVPREDATQRFALLTDRVERLTREIGARKRAEAASEAERSRLAVTLTSIGDAVIATDHLGLITLINPVAQELTGWTQTEAAGRPCSEIFCITNEYTGEEVESPVDRVLREGKIVGLANHTILTARDGRRFFIDDSGAPIRDADGELHGVVLVFRDISERKRAEDALAARRAEIEALNVRLQRAMQETHHRVKNNLQVIIGLLNLHASHHPTDVPTREIEKLTQHIQSLAAIHDLLTHQARQDDNVSDISVGEVFEKLLPIWQNIGIERPLHTQVQDLRLPIRYATALAVLVNELVSNSVKHGAGAMTLIFMQESDDAARIELTDEGKGFPDGFDARAAAHIGLELVESTVEWDLQGRVAYDNRPGGGARIVVAFPIPQTGETPAR